MNIYRFQSQVKLDDDLPITIIINNQQVNDSFNQAYNQLEKEKLKVEQKEDIKKDLNSLENELKSKDKDADRIQKIWKSLKKNASWVVPIISQVVMKGLEIAFE